mmetsp:Transcript_12054/g.55931  ORF Transcript_12054/g.55931 Transcript_12054/m.55931 type:complete len:262 (-) Transcript_12054:352-1137(-)
MKSHASPLRHLPSCQYRHGRVLCRNPVAAPSEHAPSLPASPPPTLGALAARSPSPGLLEACPFPRPRPFPFPGAPLLPSPSKSPISSDASKCPSSRCFASISLNAARLASARAAAEVSIPPSSPRAALSDSATRFCVVTLALGQFLARSSLYRRTSSGKAETSTGLSTGISSTVGNVTPFSFLNALVGSDGAALSSSASAAAWVASGCPLCLFPLFLPRAFLPATGFLCVGAGWWWVGVASSAGGGGGGGGGPPPTVPNHR